VTGVPAETAAVLIAVWWGAVGTVIGSFLNVVVYRLPAGMSIVRPGSHCPLCKTPIRWYDNIPVFGWFVLAGRCRRCREAISPRYPLVEAFVGLMFLAVAAADFHVVPAAGAVAGIGLRVMAGLHVPGLLGLCLYHVALLCAVLAAALIEFDGFRVPVAVAGFALVVSLAGFAVLPSLEALFLALAVTWYMLVRPSLSDRPMIGLPPTAWLGLALLVWVLVRPFYV
jgi:leader peptidase (prepilin peptidase)/N-methyltransferase